MPVKPARYSLLQLVAIITAVAAAIALVRVVVVPPLGTTGLKLASLPTAIILVAVWFSCRAASVRLAIYAVVASVLSLIFLLKWLSGTDILFGHFHGPPQLVIAASICSVFAVVANAAWGIKRFVMFRWQKSLAANSKVTSRGIKSWLVDIAMALLMSASALIAGGSLAEAPQAFKEFDHYVEKRLMSGPQSIHEWATRLCDTRLPRRGDMAERMVHHYVQPGDAAAIPILSRLTTDHDPRVRRAAATTLRRLTDLGLQPAAGHTPAAFPAMIHSLNDPDPIIRREAAIGLRAAFQHPVQIRSLPSSLVPDLIHALDRPEPEVRAAAISIVGIMGPKASDAVSRLIAIVPNQNDPLRRIAVRAIGDIGPTAKSAVPQLAALVESPVDGSLRPDAAQALGNIGPAAIEAVPAFENAWSNRWLNIEDAQALYRIDPDAAAAAGIPPPSQ